MGARAQETSLPQSEQIRLNQIGFYPLGPKVAAVVDAGGDTFRVLTSDLRDTVFAGRLSEPRTATYSPRQVRIADFSDLRSTGSFVVLVPGVGYSHPFEIRAQVHAELAKASMKAFYYQRASTALPAAYAGEWQRAAGHPDTVVLVHASAATSRRPENTVIASARGWYDAGDYNKYVVNSGITMGTLLSMYEDFPEYFAGLSLDIPESGNRVPDVLDEIVWNLRWMLSMQDPEDGGVYHKLTTAEFEALTVMPADARAPRYVVQKGTAATLDFAAVTAQAGRVLRRFEREFPGLADSCVAAAARAWAWAEANPSVIYDQQALNQRFSPPISTGAYGDRTFNDEKLWAAAELYVTTGEDRYYRAVDWFPSDTLPLPSWRQVRALGYYTMVRDEARLTLTARNDVPRFKASVIAAAERLLAAAAGHPYRMVMGKTPHDFVWGSSGVAGNQGIALVQAYRLTGDERYLHFALANLDYLLGRNATGYSFVTGFGDKPPMHPHHRPSIADGVTQPVPGLLVGGPNPRAPQQDRCTSYTSEVPDEVYSDDACSYASNEIAINWNAPLAYLAAALEALQFQARLSS